MPKVPVTGMSGTGKSTALRILGQRGHRAVDTDTDEWSQWITLPDGTADWVWREDAITRLLASHRHGHLFVAACKTNPGKFYAQFDHIALLSAPADIMLTRVTARNNNPYGKDPGQQALILQDLAWSRSWPSLSLKSAGRSCPLDACESWQTAHACCRAPGLGSS